jgi:hypothetical protein
MADDGKIICANKDCRIAEGGGCVEGLEPKECPYYGRESDDGGEAHDDFVYPEDLDHHRLPTANALDLKSASRSLRKSGGRVIAVIGPKGSGKTSLIAGFYDLFQAGSIAGIEFARSETLYAFELACHDTRYESRRTVPEMERTAYGEAKFYHVDVATTSGDLITLLIADRAGEEYRIAADNVEDVAPFPELVRADVVAILVDGERLADAGERHNLRSEVITIVQALQESGNLTSRQHIQLIMTKLDAVEASPRCQRVHDEFASLHARIATLAALPQDRVHVAKVAASPKTKKLQRGTGVDEVIAFWAAAEMAPISRGTTPTTPKRAFSRFVAPQTPETEND